MIYELKKQNLAKKDNELFIEKLKMQMQVKTDQLKIVENKLSEILEENNYK